MSDVTNELLKASLNIGRCLAKAYALITGDRQEKYGEPRETFAEVAHIAGVIRGKKFDALDYPAFMIAAKWVREGQHPQEDNRVDAAGYTALYDYLAQTEGENE